MNNENLIQLIYDDLQGMKKQQKIMNDRLDGMDKHFNSLEAKVLENTVEIKKINLCFENEIRPSIMRIAEAHLDLNRKLDEALKIDQQKEKMALRLNFLEGRMDRLEANAMGSA